METIRDDFARTYADGIERMYGEEPEAHLHTSLMEPFAEVLLDSNAGKGGPPDVDQLWIATVQRGPLTLSVRCPQCGSLDTRESSRFGSTACKSLWVCGACREPFDHFKTL
jgi:hypothetical protein